MADSKAGPQSAEELTTFVQSMLAQMQSRFQQMSDEIITKIDDLGNRIEELDEQVSKMSDREKETRRSRDFMIERERERGDWGLAMCASLCDEILLSRVKIEIASSSFCTT